MSLIAVYPVVTAPASIGGESPDWTDRWLYYSIYDGTNWGAATQTNLPTPMWASPSAVMWNGVVQIFQQGAFTWSGDVQALPANGELLSSYFNGTFYNQGQVPNVGMSVSPSAVPYGYELYVFHQGGYENGQLFYSVYIPGSGWQADTQLPNVGMSESPSAVQYGDDLYVFHQGGYQNGQLFYSVYIPGSGWQADTQVPNVGMSESPSAVVYEGKLYVFHQGGYQKGELWYSVYDGTNWYADTQVPNVGMSGSPSAVVWNGRLYVFHQQSGQPGDNESGWGPLGETNGDGGWVNEPLWFSNFDGTGWSNDTQVPQVGLCGSPSMVVTA